MTKTIKEIAYQKYQLDWMMKHGYGIGDLIELLAETEKEAWDCGLPDANCESVFDDWELDVGFNGSLWVCFNEFLGAEYVNRPYMQDLLDSTEFNLWLKDTSCRDTTRREMRELTDGDVFIINGVEYIADGDAHKLEDPDFYGEYIVYDEDGNSWFEEDFMDE